ncbi:MAG: hypothetical protein F9K48_09695 [Candidatus Brocadia sp.]|nr:MAG: hypothetical protein F9K48_09695 [Candidatus Brocadia sp.]
MSLATIPGMTWSFAKLPALAIKWGALFLAISLSFGFAATGHAKSLTNSKNSYEEKTLQIWDQDVQYHYLVKKNPNVDFDGETFFEILNGQKIFRVVINPVYFEKEAGILFRRFSRDKEQAVHDRFDFNSAKLFQLENHLSKMSHWEQVPAELPFDPQVELKRVQRSLEKLAWQGLFEDCRKNAKSLKEAERKFVEKFTQDRIATIERHEAAHVLDLKKATKSITDQEGFARFTELNAFYTELAFGTNPLDVMSQAIAGLVEELDKGKPVDFSVAKVASIISFLKKCPRFASRFSAKKMTKCCLEMMGEFTHKDFQLTATELYRKNYQGFKPIFVSLR